MCPSNPASAAPPPASFSRGGPALAVFAILSPSLLQILNLAFPSDYRVFLSNACQSLAAIAAFIVLNQTLRICRQTLPATVPVWQLLRLSTLFWALGACSFMFIEVVLKQHPYPGPPDFFYLLAYPPMIAGLLRLPGSPLPRSQRLDILLDVVAMVVVTLLALWHFVLSGLLQDAITISKLGPWFSLIYTSLDVLLLLVLFGALRRQLVHGVPLRSVLLLIVSCCALVAADFAQAQLSVEQDFTSGTWADLGWVLFSSLLGLSGLAQQHETCAPPSTSTTPAVPRTLAVMVLTYLWIGTMFLVLLNGAIHQTHVPPASLVIGSLCVIVLIIIRQVREVRANDRLRLELQNEFHQLSALNARLAAREQQLRASNETKDKFLSLIGHDLRNPLQVILLASDTIASFPESYNQHDTLDTVRKIAASSREMNSLLNNLLTWARSQSGALQFEPSRIRLADVVEAAAGLVALRVQQKTLSLTLSVPGDLHVMADPNMLEAVVRNLLSNAIKFTPNGGTVSITASRIHNLVQVTVRDSGIGLTPEDTAKLFRIDIPNREIGSSPEKGTGLGLVLCKEFIERHRGTISAQSQPNVGSTFTFTIPAAPP